MDAVLDIVVAPDGTWRWKDEEELEEWLARGRFTAAEVEAIRADGRKVAADLDAGRRWWSGEWARGRRIPPCPCPSCRTGGSTRGDRCRVA